MKIVIESREHKKWVQILSTMICNYDEYYSGKEKLKYAFGEAEIEADEVTLLVENKELINNK